MATFAACSPLRAIETTDVPINILPGDGVCTVQLFSYFCCKYVNKRSVQFSCGINLVSFLRYSMSKNVVTFLSEVTQGH